MTEPTTVIPDVLRILDITGILANALLGGALARRYRLDPVGFVTLAVLSGLGGGVIRDVLLQQGPPVALTDPAYLTTALLAALLAWSVQFQGKLWQRVFPWIDALAIGAWASAGTEKALLAGLGWVPAILLGVVTAVGGGAVRDVILGRMPAIFGGSTLYATSATLSGVTVVPLREIGYVGPEVPLIATFLGGALCLISRWRGWGLPAEPRWSSARRRAAKVARSFPNHPAARGRVRPPESDDETPAPARKPPPDEEHRGT